VFGYVTLITDYSLPVTDIQLQRFGINLSDCVRASPSSFLKVESKILLGKHDYMWYFIE
jgi:hypothetical protein